MASLPQTSDSNPSLKTAFASADSLRKSLEETFDCNCENYQEKLRSAIAGYEECKKAVEAVSLFSPNETLEDVSSSELKYMLIDFYLGELNMKRQNVDRKSTLIQAQKFYKAFLRLCDSYDLLSTKDREMSEVLSQATSARNLAYLPSDPGARRQAKISRYRQEKELKAKLEILSKNPNLNLDEDVARELYTALIDFSIMQALQALEGILQELDILKLAPPPGENPSQQQVIDDPRMRGAHSDPYSDKLDSPSIFNNKNGVPLLSADGRPLRPFTLLDTRDRLKKGVFRPGHNLPTMTIDEYLEEERRRGNIIEGGGEKSGIQPEPDEDNYEKADAATMRARQWDEFTEENPRGSGNTMNRG